MKDSETNINSLFDLSRILMVLSCLALGFLICHFWPQSISTSNNNQEVCQVLPSCNNNCKDTVETCLTKKGIEHECGSIIVSFSCSKNIERRGDRYFVDGEYDLEAQLDTMFINYLDTANGGIATIPSDIDNTNLDYCLCDQNLFIYRLDGLPTHAECGVVDSPPPPFIDEDGGVLSLNYIIKKEGNVPNFTALYQQINPESCTCSGGDNCLDKIKSNILPIRGAKIIAILDTGYNPDAIDQKHLYKSIPYPGECLSNDELGWNFVANNNNVQADNDHSAVVTLAYLNGIEINGTDETKQKILNVKVLDGCGVGTVYGAACGIYYAIRKGANIINASWGLSENSIILQNAIRDAAESGVMIVASAGNDSRNLNPIDSLHFPSGYAHTFIKVDSTIVANGYKSMVAEVGGLCASPFDTNLSISKLWLGSNVHNNMFVEPAVNFQYLLEDLLEEYIFECSSEGTSFSAPMLSADIMHSLIAGVRPIDILEKLREDSHNIIGNVNNDHYYQHNF